MVDQNELSMLAVALTLAGVAVLAAYLTEGRESNRLLSWLVAIWLLACSLARTS
jgi:hypothetical protein